MTTKPLYTGRLTRDPKTGAISAWIEDTWRWRISLRGEWDPASGDYILTGDLGEVPDGLRVTAIDGEKK